MQSQAPAAVPQTRSVGRPRKLSFERIVDAACDVGVAKLDMGLVAERLNTGVATLYGYVKDREHLLELVAERLAGESRIVDRGQSWQDVVREHAAITYALFQSQPQLITKLMDSVSDPGALEYWRRLYDMLNAKGLVGKRATDIYIETNQVVIGAAVCMMRRKTIEARGGDAEVNPKDLAPILGDYKPTLERIIAGYEAEAESYTARTEPSRPKAGRPAATKVPRKAAKDSG